MFFCHNVNIVDKTQRRQKSCVLPILVICIGPTLLLISGCSKKAERTPNQALSRDAWHETMSQTPTPKNKKGCFTATYPKTQWNDAACATPPNRPYPFRHGYRRPDIVGNGTDYAAEVPNLITGATGSFSGVTGVTSESGDVGGNPPAVANTFSLQLNSKPFSTTICNTSPNQLCQGWQQFVYSNAGFAFIQYWLLQYNTTCPAGFNTYPNGGQTDCWKNGANAVSVPVQAISNLASLSLSGYANTDGTDTVIMTTAGGNMSAANMDSVLNLASGWNGVEFVLVGDCCSSQATFNAGSTLVVNTTVHHGSTTNAPTCVLDGFTGETNNLTLVGTGAVPIQPAPAILSTQSNIAGTPQSCATAAGLGDTHLTTFQNLFYDFQAVGDFLLAETGPDFIVQARQISGKPNWPNASVNQAVATRMGATEVAVCLPDKLEVDRAPFTLADGKSVMLQNGVFISRTGNVYLVTDQSGNSIRAEINNGYINASVGLGRWPTRVFGLLANAAGTADEIAPRQGPTLKAPFNFENLYSRYGNTWRVSANESLLLACGETPQQSNPAKPLTVNDLTPQDYKRARNVCVAAGVKDEALLQACSIDVVVLKSDKAAEVFAHAPAPTVVGNQIAPAPSGP